MNEPEYRLAVYSLDGTTWHADIELATVAGHVHWERVYGVWNFRKEKAIALADKEIAKRKAANAATRKQQAIKDQTMEILAR